VGVKSENGSRNPDHTDFRGGLSSVSWDLIYSTRVYSFTTLASVIPEISLEPPSF